MFCTPIPDPKRRARTALTVRARLLAAALVTATSGAAFAQSQPAPEATSTVTTSADQPASAEPADTSDAQRRLESLEQQVATQQASRDAEAMDLAALRAEVEQLHAPVEPAPVIPTVQAGLLGVTLSGYLQSDGVLYRQSSEDELNPSTGEPLNQTRFLIRRARLRADLTAPWVSGALELDANTVHGPAARIQAAEVAIRYQPDPDRLPLAKATIGLFKIPFGYEVLQSDRDRLFLERSNAENVLFPGEYDLGAMVSGGWNFLRYSVALMNGHPIGEKAYPGRDPISPKDLVGRVGVDTRLESVGIVAGASFLLGNGFTPGSPATKDQLVWHDVNEDNQVQLTEIQVIQGYPALPSEKFARSALGGDAVITIPLPQDSSVQAFGELYWASNLDRAFQVANPVLTGRALRELGYVAGITGTFRKHYFAGVRYDAYQPDRDASEIRNGVQVARDNSVSTTAVVVGVRIPPFARLMAEYDHNTNNLGRALDGQPALLPDDAFTVRAEVAF